MITNSFATNERVISLFSFLVIIRNPSHCKQGPFLYLTDRKYPKALEITA